MVVQKRVMHKEEGNPERKKQGNEKAACRDELPSTANRLLSTKH